MTTTHPETVDPQEDELTKAIDDLRDVLHEEEPATGGAHHAMGGAPLGNSVIMNIPVDVQIMLGSTEMKVAELMALQKGSTVALDRRIGEPVDVMVNGRKIAKGEITVLDNDPSRFGIRLLEIVAAVKQG